MIDTTEQYLRQILSKSFNSYKSFRYEAITVTGTLSTLTVPDGAIYADMRLESTAIGNAARFLQNKSVEVTSTVGMPLSAGSILEVKDFANLNGFQIIKDQAGTTVLHVQYYK